LIIPQKGAQNYCQNRRLGYDWVILLNKAINWMLQLVGGSKVSLSKRLKFRKKAVKFIADFEEKPLNSP